MRRISRSVLAALCTQFGSAVESFAAEPNSVLLEWDPSPSALESARLARPAEHGAHRLWTGKPERPGVYTLVKSDAPGVARGSMGRDAVGVKVVDMHPGQEYTFVVQYGETQDGTTWAWSVFSNSVNYLVPKGGPTPTAELRAFGLTAAELDELAPRKTPELPPLRLTVTAQQGGMLIQVQGAPGQKFVLQYSDRVTGDDEWGWRTLDGASETELPVDGKYAFFDPVPRNLVVTHAYDQTGQESLREEIVPHAFRFYRLVAASQSSNAAGK